LQSFRILLNTYDPTTVDGSGLKAPVTSTCIVLSPPPPTGSSVNTGFYIPEGDGSGSPIDVTIQGFTDGACGAGQTDFHFNNGLAAASGTELFRNDGISIGLNTNVVFLEHEGPPTASSAAPASNLNSLNGIFPL